MSIPKVGPINKSVRSCDCSIKYFCCCWKRRNKSIQDITTQTLQQTEKTKEVFEKRRSSDVDRAYYEKKKDAPDLLDPI